MDLLKSILLSTILLSSLAGFAEPCTITVKEFISEAGCSRDLQQYPAVEAASWQSCFNYAESMAAQIGYSSEPGFVSIDSDSCRVPFTGNTLPKRVVTWLFQDAPTYEQCSHGSVNSETVRRRMPASKGEQVLNAYGDKLF